VLSEFEADLVAERTKSALGHLRNQGKRISGRIPYGYDLAPDGESLIPNSSEQEGIRFMLAQRAAGNGRRKIASAMTAHGFLTKTGVSWSPQAVGNILRREKLMQSSVTHVAA
jgi:DNA invertase Pin-like site-specific DNA recombinase